MFSPAFVIKHMRVIDNSCFTFIHINLKTNELKKDIIEMIRMEGFFYEDGQ